MRLPAFLAFVALAYLASPALAIDAPVERPILHVDGKLTAGKAANWTRSDIEKLGMTTIRTSTPWHDGVQTFEGVPLDAFMKMLGADGSKAVVAAINKYQIEIPLDDFTNHNVILALKRNGQYMDVKDKGPLFVIYPFDDAPELKKEVYYGRSAWQVRSITVE